MTAWISGCILSMKQENTGFTKSLQRWQEKAVKSPRDTDILKFLALTDMSAHMHIFERMHAHTPCCIIRVLPIAHVAVIRSAPSLVLLTVATYIHEAPVLCIGSGCDVTFYAFYSC